MSTKLLVVEDSPRHREEALNFVSKHIKKSAQLELDFATSFSEAKMMVQKTCYGGILTDIFMPTESENDEQLSLKASLAKARAREYMEAIEDTAKYVASLYIDEMPYAVLLAETALREKIPIVFITDTYHHGDKTEPVNSWSKFKGIPLIDNEDGEENDHRGKNVVQKNWQKGFLTLLWMVEGKKSNTVIINSEEIKSDLSFGWINSLLEDILFNGPKRRLSHRNDEGKEGFREMVEKFFII
ncbi:MAG: hypothetical protein US81_C0008G0004 [Parcubacteria group bacterium GW2011_GWE2_38_18]|nr:MAG: hypothetical protein US81_C0008G0004 [Parcubacteria group bacterium GW2011_GWE2_38_18]